LTDPPGLDIISNCKKTPAFHPHPDLPIYTVSGLDVYIAKKKKKKKIIDVFYMLGAEEGGGHVNISDYDFKVLDLRDKK
jgi:hypothetical protein